MVITMLKVENLWVKVEDKEILKGINLNIGENELHVVMGPNGSGKSTLALTIAGHPKYKVIQGSILFEGEEITSLPPEERVKKGIFLSFQHPVEVDGVKIIHFLQRILKNLKGMDEIKAYEAIYTAIKELGLDESILTRFLNVGFSGGERKKLEMLQAYLVEPKLLILDEPDSGVDVDSLKTIAKIIRRLYERGTSVLLITHYGRILEYLNPTKVHVIKNGKIVASGSIDLVKIIEERGYSAVGDNEE
nr:hypothetical ATP-dependent transporter [Pyrococcus furiosus]